MQQNEITNYRKKGKINRQSLFNHYEFPEERTEIAWTIEEQERLKNTILR